MTVESFEVRQPGINLADDIIGYEPSRPTRLKHWRDPPRVYGALRRVDLGRAFIRNLILRHYGPGPHPGTGTPQSVHGGTNGGDSKPRGEIHAGTNGGEIGAEYPIAGDFVEGLKVRESIPNQDSIGASLNDFEVLPGIRVIRFDDFPDLLPEPYFYSVGQRERAKDLAEGIRESKEINPLIVVLDAEPGPYVLEGATRFDALQILGVAAFPALVVIDREAIPYD